MNLGEELAIIMGIPIIIVIEMCKYIKSKRSKKKFWNFRECGIILLQLYIIALITVILLPFRMGGITHITVNLVPVFNTISDIYGDISQSTIPWFMVKFWAVNIVGNLLILSPLATLVPLVFKKYRSIKATVILCLSVSVTIEVLQYVFMYFGNIRSADIDDVILNTLGAFIGYAVFELIHHKQMKARICCYGGD
ncbi:Glycopeptide antibiotics resistance protein [Hathewaya proteolytica DSM 3090]|uniref:Glycopeptide antibiotics resistance protein n=1 Tax=Hathewaya proteolytica DSM 3090 TaxID=1121331 RepID=A0A1M6MXA4_9CLOT|nr:VanZ family protein [Hathewaya proteolytica]SHJ87943.1 Glycopeptide antibiotics resistance protein [Hathewaya proteolytica DSM 3090]